MTRGKTFFFINTNTSVQGYGPQVSVRGGAEPRATVQLGGLGQLKDQGSRSKFLNYIYSIRTGKRRTSSFFLILNLFVRIRLRVLDQVQGFPSNATLFNSCLLFYSNYPLHVSVVRLSSSGNIYIGN
jgi:hypothetical protein